MTATPPPAWIGAPPTRGRAVATLHVGATAVMIAGLQPLGAPHLRPVREAIV